MFVGLPRLFEVKDAKETRGGGREDDMGAWECCARSHFGAAAKFKKDLIQLHQRLGSSSWNSNDLMNKSVVNATLKLEGHPY